MVASDVLGAMRWRCNANSGEVALYSTGLVEGRGLRHLAGPSGWLPNQVRVEIGSQTLSAAWWDNTVVNVRSVRARVADLLL